MAGLTAAFLLHSYIWQNLVSIIEINLKENVFYSQVKNLNVCVWGKEHEERELGRGLMQRSVMSYLL